MKGSRRKGKLSVRQDELAFEIAGFKDAQRMHLQIPFSKMEKIFLSRDNYYGTDTVLFNLTFRDPSEHCFTLRFAPITVIPRRRMALQKAWFDYLAETINSSGSASPLSTK